MHAAAKQVVKSDTNNDRSPQKKQNQMMVMMMPSPALNAPASHGLAVMCLEHPQ